MAKDSYYFSHDANARNDPKILAMRSEYGFEGYGWYWAIIEMMREQSNFKLSRDKWTLTAIAMQTQCDRTKIASFIEDCINEFELFQSDDDYFWSESLLRRMKALEKKREQAKKAANARWNNDEDNDDAEDNADAMRTHSGRNADNMQPQCNLSKVNKVNEFNKREFNKNNYAEQDFSSEPLELFEIRKLFHKHCPTLNEIRPVGEWSAGRKKAVQARWREHPDYQFWIELFKRVENSDFLTGKKKDFVADFDMIMQKDKFTRILEGRYDNRKTEEYAGVKALMEDDDFA
jgi:hypothetical protein